MPHNRLQFQGGVNVQDTPVINTAGIAVSNRIRFKYDPLGLSLPEKLGGWAKFSATQFIGLIFRALWAWQDTDDGQWLAFGTDNTGGHAELGVLPCTVSGSTGLTTGGTVQDITPRALSDAAPPAFQTTISTSLYTSLDPNLGGALPNTMAIYVTTPISVGGNVLRGLYNTLTPAGGSGTLFQIEGTDVLGNPLNAAFTSTLLLTPITVTSVAFSGGALTFHFTGPYTVTVGTGFKVVGLTPTSANGSYVATSSSTTSVTAATTLGSYTYASGGQLSNNGTIPQFFVTSGSPVVTVIYANNGFNVGDTFEVLNETLVGGIKLFGAYQVISIVNAWTFTIQVGTTIAAITAQQYQNALTITGGTGNGTSVTLTYNANTYNQAFEFGTWINVAGITNPTAWNGHYVVTSATHGTVTFANATAGTWVAGGSIADEGGDAAFIYTFSPNGGQPQGTGFPINANYWSLDNWGNYLLALPVNSFSITYPDDNLPFQPIYYWDPTAGQQNAFAITNGPSASNGMFVATPERQIIAWGCSGPDPGDGLIDPLLIRWCDINNFNDWIAQVTNQAGSFRLSSGATIIGARQVAQQLLFFTDIELWVAQYINQPLVYGFNKIGQGCGLIGRNAHGVLGGITYWMSKTQFFMLSGNGVVSIPCPIWDVVFQDLDLVNINKIVCAPNSMFQEISWYFPVRGGNGENSQYIKLNVGGLAAGQPPVWDYGSLDRSAWIDVSILQQPIGYSPSNVLIYQHEISPDADGVAMGESFTTGWFALSEGDVMPFIDQIWPDFHWGYFGQAQNASVTFTMSGQDYPGQTAQTIGPYTINQATTYISPRMRHRMLSFTVSGTGTGTWWRLGGLRYRYQPDGKF